MITETLNKPKPMGSGRKLREDGGPEPKAGLGPDGLQALFVQDEMSRKEFRV